VTAFLRDAVICEPLRTPVGGYGGVLRDVPAVELAAGVIRALIARTGIEPDMVDDVILGQCYPNGEAPAIGRVAALDAGLPVDVPGVQLDRRCGSGLQAVINAAMQVQTGVSDLVLAGGVDSMSQAEFYSTDIRWGVRGGEAALHDRLARGRVTAGGQHYPVPGGMLETAENLRREYRIARAEQDAFALASHRKAVAAQADGRFAQEIVPVTVRTRKGDVEVDTDEHPRADASAEKLAALRPVLRRSDPEATVTAGNASGQNDGAAICVVTIRRERPNWGCGRWAASSAGRSPGCRRRPWASAQCRHCPRTVPGRPQTRRHGPDRAERGVRRAGDRLPARMGPRPVATMLREMDRRHVRYGLETMCIGGGQGLAAVFERVV
jgi:acetyl-CoA C-acetyltransferase